MNGREERGGKKGQDERVGRESDGRIAKGNGKGVWKRERKEKGGQEKGNAK